jgi:hypothetical protein
VEECREVFRGLKEFAMQFFYKRHCAFAYRATISVVPCDFYPLKTLATGRKGRRILQKLRLVAFRIIWRSAWCARAERSVEAAPGRTRLTTFNSSPMKWLKRGGTSCDGHQLTPCTPLNPETLRQIPLKHCAN